MLVSRVFMLNLGVSHGLKASIYSFFVPVTVPVSTGRFWKCEFWEEKNYNFGSMAKGKKHSVLKQILNPHTV